jgi:hypothetical protein
MNEFYSLGLNGERYYLDIDAISKWCLSSSVNPSKETEINEGYDYGDNGDFQMTTKVIRELKTSNSQDDTIRYDFIKVLLSPFLGEIKEIDEIENNFSYAMIFNTLVKMNFLIKIND